MSNISDRLKELRTELGLSRSELGRKMGLSRSYMSRLESNERSNIDSRCLDELKRQLLVNPEWLLTGNGNKYVATKEDTELPPEKSSKKLFRIVSASAPEVKISTLEMMLEACEEAKDFDCMAVIARELMRRTKVNGNAAPNKSGNDRGK